MTAPFPSTVTGIYSGFPYGITLAISFFFLEEASLALASLESVSSVLLLVVGA